MPGSYCAWSGNFPALPGDPLCTSAEFTLHALQHYARARSRDRADAEGDMLTAFFKPEIKLTADMEQ